MTFTNDRAGMLIYTLNALASREPDYTVHDAARDAEAGFVDSFLAKLRQHDLDTSMFELYFADGTAGDELDDMFVRWTNAADSHKFLLSYESNGWLWLSSIAVNVFLVSPYGDQTAILN
ncbi:hypothetical protein [uncultured Salinibacterium sp.]|uniref:hypothetical protein n=1 Tax=uncultured Salinibacterium sp. TaxID=459274 RepID=UPI0030D7D4FB|tara:strand:+ start:73607 stop:73963 length:357 start_codon:yes stop_codon:yes gene_type:complete